MKIISCYIVGFGKFQNQKIDFQSNLLVLKQDNGWGKTTLADFIRCMFYGMDGGRTKSVESNDRLRYIPWNSSQCGGWLTFSYRNNVYRVERAFGKTPAQDVARVLDSNNMPCYEFGDKAEKLGETLFGMDAESYKRTAYIPQNEEKENGLPQDIRARLTAVLGISENVTVTENDGDRVAMNAVERLDAADKKLRARRRPAKGLLDEIDERLAALSRLKTEREENALRLQRLRVKIAEAEAGLAECQQNIAEFSKALEERQRSMPLSQTQLAALRADVEGLTAFFKGAEPSLINVEGIQGAVAEYYTVKSRVTEIEERLAETEVKYREKATVKARLDACEKVMETYEGILGCDRDIPEDKPKYKKITPPYKDWMGLVIIASLFAIIGGAILMGVQWIVGAILAAAGAVGGIIVVCNLMPRREKLETKKKETPKPTQLSETERANFTAKYDQAKVEYAEIQAELARFAPDLDASYESMRIERDGAAARASALEQGIANFFASFAFAEVYDYRAALAMLKDKIAAYAEKTASLAACDGAMVTAVSMDQGEEAQRLQGDIETLKAHKFAWESRKDELTETRARAIADAAQIETLADPAAVYAEEEQLLAEKDRLEKRHKAICTARQILLRAKDNLATRYLEPVEKGCRYYMGLLGGVAADRVRFSADGVPLIDEDGVLRALEGYSTGVQDLLSFCVRIALADVLFTEEKPVLVFDDPFVNLDDDKTERAKWLTREISKNYQILYLTCKQERAL